MRTLVCHLEGTGDRYDEFSAVELSSACSLFLTKVDGLQGRRAAILLDRGQLHFRRARRWTIEAAGRGTLARWRVGEKDAVNRKKIDVADASNMNVQWHRALEPKGN